MFQLYNKWTKIVERMKKIQTKIDWFLVLFFVFLGIKAIFYNYIYDIVQHPDYDYHLSLVKIYSKNPTKLFFWNPQDVKIECNDPVRYSPRVAASPFLYHSVVGKILYLTKSLRWTSLIQSIFGLMTIYYVYMLGFLISKNKFVGYLSLVIAGNLPMFFYEINYITYDNLVNLAGVASIYYFMKFWMYDKISDFMALLIFLTIGVMTKISFGPLLLIIIILLVIVKNKLLLKIPGKYFVFLKNTKSIFINLILIFLVTTGFIFYLRNYVKYKSFFPSYSYDLERDCK